MDSAKATLRRAEVMASVKKDWASGEKSSGSDAMVSNNLFDDEMCLLHSDFEMCFSRSFFL